MEDERIIALYRKRDEAAISETEQKYGALLRRLAGNILTDRHEAADCVSDAYFQTWNAIPPQRPQKLCPWLARLVRNNAIDRWRSARAQKRQCEMTLLLEELDECIPAPQSVAQEVEARELTEYLNTWLASLSKDDRILFMRRYWNGEPLKALARERGIQPEKLAQKMYRLRRALKAALEKEGLSL